MRKNDLYKCGNEIIRVLELTIDKAFIIDCVKRTVPKWIDISLLEGYLPCSEQELFAKTNITPIEEKYLDAEGKKSAHEKYTLIAGILPFITDERERCRAINRIEKYSNLSRQTIVKALCLYLVYQNISVLSHKKYSFDRPLTADEKNMRWALNKFFYNSRQNSLRMAYTLMLQEKYCSKDGTLQEKYPSIYQFRYFYRKHKSMQTYYISRNGKTDYQRNSRPLLGDGVNEFAPAVGVGMLDATICDIYLVNKEGHLIGRPILTACVDAYSRLCCGYTLTLEGGVYSLRNLMANVISDKTELCKKYGICIEEKEWNCTKLPAVLVTDMGKEYISGTFEQIADLGVTVVNLPPYRPELKGVVEKFFDVIQGLYKPHLKGKGVIDADFRERGAHDYRKDAVLTFEDFEKIVLHCIIYYNNNRIMENFAYTEKMLTEGIRPTASEVWNCGISEVGANLIEVNENILMKTLLPRTNGTFKRRGLFVNKLRYRNDNYTEHYLKGGSVKVAYNPKDVSRVWVIENGNYVEFTLIEGRFEGLEMSEVDGIRDKQRKVIKESDRENIQARINLAKQINFIAEASLNCCDANIKGIRENRKREQRKIHIDYLMGGNAHE